MAARLLQIGGPEWMVRASLEQVGRQVYGEDVERATELVFSLLHLDLPACTLALLVQVLPRCLSGEGKEGLLAYPSGRALARLAVQCLGAALANRSSPPYLSVPGRAFSLEHLCNGASRQGKRRRLTGGEAQGVAQESPGQECLVEEAHSGLFQLLSSIGQEPVLSPRLEFVSCLLEESVLTGRDQARAILAPLPTALVMQLVKVQPKRFSLELITKLFDNSTSSGRKTTARLLCLVRNMKSGIAAEEPEV